MNNEIGAKTRNLKILSEMGLSVPKLDYISAKFLTENSNQEGVIDKQKLTQTSKQLHEKLKCQLYAVRSSALIEDSEAHSYAGQFQTKLAVKPEDLPDAIQKITSHAHHYLKGDLSKFSIIIQQYIDPDYAGITFTRNPAGSRELVIEYHKGIGEEVVSGKVKPQTILLHHTARPQETLPNLKEAFQQFIKIEQHFSFPQDIEWAIKDGKWFFLQSRPITTISKEDFRSYLYLDKHLPQKPFYYEKTELSEIAPRPTTFTANLIEELYAKNGPIDQVYKRYKINYRPKKARVILGNQLYTDMEKELKTLLPAYSYLGSNPPSPKISSIIGLFTSFKNIYRLNRIKTTNHKQLYNKISEAIKQNISAYDLEKLLEKFKQDYQLIFETNLLAGISIKRLLALTKDQINIAQLLSHGHSLKLQLPKLTLESENLDELIGNTLEIADDSTFVKNHAPESTDIYLSNWWTNLSKIKKQLIEPKIIDALTLNRLREYTRWLTVLRVNQIRKLLHKIAIKAEFKSLELIYFAKLEELKTPDQQKCQTRHKKYSSFDKHSFPKNLFFKPIQGYGKRQGISPGQAEGLLITEDQLKNADTNEKHILLTKVLSPSLVQYFPKIKGILSEQGGMLSHLAIIAREKSLPVITNITFNKYKQGQHVQIDGASGEIKTQKNS